VSDAATLSEWIPLDSRELNQPSTEKVGDVEIIAYSSPYDVPAAMGTYRDENNNPYRIDFRYIGGEEPTKPETMDDVTLWFGRRSGRLYRIDVNTAEQRDIVGAVVEKAINDLVNQGRLLPEHSNYDLVKTVLSENLHSSEGSSL
jgi:hypothetical protein